jgi:hypothetical protein
MSTTTHHLGFGRTILCGLAACVLTIMLLGGIVQSPAQTARLATLELTQA